MVAFAVSGVVNETWMYLQLENVTMDFASQFYKLDIPPDLDCDTLGGPDNPLGWNLLNAIYFTTSIITTIGERERENEKFLITENKI